MDGSVQKQSEAPKKIEEFTGKLKSLEPLIHNYIEHAYASTSLVEHKDVKKFLEWLSINDKKLTVGLKDDIKKEKLHIRGLNFTEEQISFLLGFWLGGKYVVSQCVSSPTPKFPELWLLFGSGYDTEKNYLTIEPPLLTELVGKTIRGNDNCFIAGFNMGIHEHTHALPGINGSKNAYLPEIAAYINTVQFGLPLKAGKTVNIFELAAGKRDILNIIEQRKDQRLKINASELLSEYAEMWIGPWILAYYEKLGKNIDVFDFQVSNKNAKLPPALFEITSNPGAFVPKENFFLKERIKKWPNGYTADDLCKASGIKDLGVKALLAPAFDKIRGRTFRTYSELVDFFIATMNETFGAPKSELLPPGFVYLEKAPEKISDGTSALSDVVPKKRRFG